MAGIVCALDLLHRSSSIDLLPYVSQRSASNPVSSSATARGPPIRFHSRCFRNMHALCSSLLGMYISSNLRHERRWWMIHRSVEERRGFWESKVPMWHRKAEMFAPGEAEDFLDHKYGKTYRVDQRTFHYLVRTTRGRLQHEHTWLRSPIAPEKRLAICLHWMAHGITFNLLGEIYHIGTSTAHAIVHEVVSVLKETIVKSSIKFPAGGRELDVVMDGFHQAAGLQMCAGAVDGTFVHMLKPSVWGDTYWCYKNHIAILLLGVCDHRGQFTFIDVGRAGCVGDAFTYNASSLRRKIHDRTWLHDTELTLEDCTIRPYLIADGAFPLEPQLMKCYDHPRFEHQRRFNKAITSTRKKVEIAFGRYKGRWHVLVNNHIKEPAFMRDVALVCSALHNICERANCPYQTKWDVEQAEYVRVGPALPPYLPENLPGGSDVRYALSQSL